MYSLPDCRIGVLCLALALGVVSCGRPPQTVHARTGADPSSSALPQDRYADDLARFLAGLPARSGSPFLELQNNPIWVKHREELNRSWARFEESSLPAMRAFARQEVGATAISAAPVFYPFSGPDSLMATVFFPDSPSYLLVGLEPAGTLPTLRQVELKNLAAYLAGVRASVASELGRSFFITRQMDRQFRGQVTDGLFLPILQLLVRSNHTILGFRYIRLDDKGQVMERPAVYKDLETYRSKGVEIEFRRDDDQSVHTLQYFSIDLSNKGLRENQPFLTFLDRQPPGATLLKATSYLVHRPEFSIVRERVLVHSLAVLQDDSGIPYRFFVSPWTIQLFGDYVRPYGSFRWFQQSDLRNAFLAPGPKPLSFRIGYGYGMVPSNLLLARKLN